ncbi:MAG: adenylate/guanylate cyclase domain-containing protein [Fimbriimonadaceae bacterium]
MGNSVEHNRVSEAMRLADYIQAYPEAITQDPYLVATEAGVDPELVKDVQAAVQQRTAIQLPIWERIMEVLKIGWQRLQSFSSRISLNPNTTLIATALLILVSIVVVQGISMVFVGGEGENRARRISLDGDSVILVVVGALMLVQLYVCARSASWKYGVLTGLYNAAVFSALIFVGVHISDPDYAIAAILGKLFLSVLAGFVLGMLVGFLALLAALIGGLVAVQVENQRDRKLSRHEVLARIHEIKRALAAGKPVPEGEERKTALLQRFARFVRRDWLKASIIVGLITGLVNALLLGAVTIGTTLEEIQGFSLVIAGILTMINFVVLLMVGFFSGGFWKSMFSVFLVTILQLPFSLLPIGALGPVYVWKQVTDPLQLVNMLTMVIIIGSIAGIAAVLERRGARNRKLKENDPAVLAAELVRMQLRVSAPAKMVTVMVTDVVGSTPLKQGHTQQDIEYSFREYHALVRRHSNRHGGKVHNMVGDGAIVAFDSGPAALQAAREIHTDIKEFNDKVNRLGPFHLRIALHCGQLSGELDDVVFTEVIDIAAHAEKLARTGSIVVTEPFKDSIVGERLRKTGNKANGWVLYEVERTKTTDREHESDEPSTFVETEKAQQTELPL